MERVQDKHKCSECAFRSLIFDKLNDLELDILDDSRVEIAYDKGEVIVKEDDEIKEFLYLKNGLVKLSKKTENDRDHIISIAKPKSFIGFLTVFSNNKYKYTITALEPSTLCFIELDTIRELVNSNGEFALDVLARISEISDHIISNRVNICSKQLRGRIAYLLIFFSQNIYLNTTFQLPITRREFGELIDMSTENVIRILSEFRKDGLIRIDGNQIEIINFEMIEMISKFG